MRTLLVLLAIGFCLAAESAPAPAYEEVVLDNPTAQVVLSSNRGHLVQFLLKASERIRLPGHLARLVEPLPEGPLPVLRGFQPAGAHNWLVDHDATAGGLTRADRAPWSVERPDARSVAFSFEREGRLRWTITYRLHESRPTLGVEFAIANLGEAAVQLAPLIVPINGLHQDYGPGEAYYCATFYHAGGVNGSLSSFSLPGAGAKQPLGDSGQGIDYLGLKSRFFAAWWTPAALAPPAEAHLAPSETPAAGPGLPAGPGPATTIAGPVQPGLVAGAWSAEGHGFTGTDAEHQSFVSVAFSPSEVAAGGTWRRGWSLSVSSMTADDLAQFSDIEQAVKYTDSFYRFFKILANALTWVLDLLASVVQHYGIAVILLTVMIKAALYRTTFKQQESMLKMQKVAPELKYLQEQYKTNKQMLAQKQMELFKKHGVNPLGGCLPIFIQLPIFIALFQAFSHSADLRGTSFLWVSDLTLPDQLIGVPLPFLGGWVLSLNPLPIIYIAVSAWMSFSMKPPTNGDPQQEMMFKMMRWMPVLFGVIFYNMPSGLVLYFTVQAVISTLEIKYIRRKLGMD